MRGKTRCAKTIEEIYTSQLEEEVYICVFKNKWMYIY